MKLYIIIVTYNGTNWLKKSLDSCLGYNVIVVDNNSKDHTVDFIKKNYPKVTLLKQEKNLGFGQANNLGISYAIKQGADYIFLLNQDAYLINASIEQMISISQNNLDFGILSPIHLNGDGNKLDRLFSSYLSYDKNNYFYFDAIDGNFKDVYEVPFVNAAGWLLPINTIHTIGGFDPIFFHYGEDNNYCQRLHYHGLKIGVVPNVKIIHDREIRINSSVDFKKEMMKKEAQLKTKWANVNLNTRKVMRTDINNLNKRIIKLMLKFDFNLLYETLRERKMLKRVILEVLNSVKMNKNKGSHYIKL